MLYGSQFVVLQLTAMSRDCMQRVDVLPKARLEANTSAGNEIGEEEQSFNASQA